MIPWFVIFFCWVVSFVFAGIEAGLLSLDQVRLRHQVKLRNRSAILLYQLMKKPERLLATILLVTKFADIAGLLEENRALRDQDQKRARWIGKLDADIAGLDAHVGELKARNAQVEEQLASFATTIREQAQAADHQRRELEQRDARLATARAALGEDESAWLRYGRVVRLSRKIPGLLAAIDRLAALRRG